MTRAAASPWHFPRSRPTSKRCGRARCHGGGQEGAEYKLGEVSLAGGSRQRAPTAQNRQVQPGEAANFDDVMQGVERIRKRLNARAICTPKHHRARPQRQNKTVNVAIRIAEAQFNFGRLTIEGLDLNGEAAMKKLWGLKR